MTRKNLRIGVIGIRQQGIWECLLPGLKNGVKRGVKCRNEAAESLENTVDIGFMKNKHIIPRVSLHHMPTNVQTLNFCHTISWVQKNS